MSMLSSPLRSSVFSNAFSSPIMAKSVNIQSSPSPQTSKWLHSSPTNPCSNPQDPTKETAALAWLDMQPSTRHNDPRIPTRRFRSRNPFAISSDSREQHRRERYLKNVQKKRDDGRWALRNDQMLRSDWLREQREWGAIRAEDAPSVPEHPDREYEELHALPVSVLSEEQRAQPPSYREYQYLKRAGITPTVVGPSGQITNYRLSPSHGAQSSSSYDQQEVDELARAEDEEVDALIAMHQNTQASSPLYDSDDELDEALASLVETPESSPETMDVS